MYGTIKFCMLIGFRRTNNFKQDHFCEKQKYENGGRFEVKIYVLLYGNNS
jgi:hypothetical protein